MTQTYTFHVNGMHCNACIFLTESEIQDVSGVIKAKSNLKNHSIEVTGEFGDKPQETIAEELSSVLKKHGYSVSVEKQSQAKPWQDFRIAAPLALVFIALFIVLQKLGIVNLVTANSVSYPTAFFIGIIASLSTCMAVVGGLVLSMSATFAKEGDMVRPQLLFHGGRIVAFFILGGILGAIGSAFHITTSATFVLSFFTGIVLLILGINLLDVFHWSKRLQPAMPAFISKHAYGIHRLNHRVTPLLVGIATFFLPCGFTQSMQIYTLSTGSFLQGGLTMLAFALGTLPVLALISFSPLSIKSKQGSSIFFKTVGLIVILFAAFNIINSLVVIGWIPAVFNF